MNRKIILHVGVGKTGSSSLQSFLSFSPYLVSADGKQEFIYCCFNQNGGISAGTDLTKLAGCSLLQYSASETDIARAEHIPQTKSDLEEIFSAGCTPIFSQEGWSYRADEFRKSKFLLGIDCTAHVIVYVRPQVEWFNSAWWQWFVWSGKYASPEDFIAKRGFKIMLWADLIAKWKDVPGVESVRIRLQTKDIVEDFRRLLGIAEVTGLSPSPKVNVGLNQTLIKLLLRYPELRGENSADVDAVLQKHFVFEGATPWVLGTELISKIITETYADNQRLLEMLDEESRQSMQSDRRWWDPEFYASRAEVLKKELKLSRNEMIDIIDQAIPALSRLQVIAGKGWWDPDYYSSRPRYDVRLPETKNEDLLGIIDAAVPALIRLERLGVERVGKNEMSGVLLQKGQELSLGALRILHYFLVNRPYYLFRGTTALLWTKVPISYRRKNELKQLLFSKMPWLFSWSGAYRRWQATNATMQEVKKPRKK